MKASPDGSEEFKAATAVSKQGITVHNGIFQSKQGRIGSVRKQPRISTAQFHKNNAFKLCCPRIRPLIGRNWHCCSCIALQ